MSDTSQAQIVRHRGTRWTVLAVLAAIVTSAVPLGTFGRLGVAVLFAIAIVALVHQHGNPDHHGWTLGAALVFIVVSWLHVGLTSPSVAWAVDSHMIPWLPLPNATARIAIAWSCTLAWTVLVAVAAVQIRGLRARLAAIVALALTAVLPLFNPEAFPVDAYELLWNRSTFTHPTYTLALVALLVTIPALHPRPSDSTAGNVQPPRVDDAVLR